MGPRINRVFRFLSWEIGYNEDIPVQRERLMMQAIQGMKIIITLL